MPRNLSAALTNLIHQIESTDPLVFLFELNSASFPGGTAERWAANVEPVTFHGAVYPAFPVDVDSLSENMQGSLQQLRLTASNVDQTIISLFERFFRPVEYPDWEVTVWQVMLSDPDQTPLNAGMVFEVLSADITIMSAVVNMRAGGISMTQILPKRRFTSTGGFPNII